MTQSKDKIDIEAVAKTDYLIMIKNIVYWLSIRRQYANDYLLFKDYDEFDKLLQISLIESCNDNIAKLLAL